MNDDAEKVFEATPQRIDRAKREGNVARSSELSANLAFAAAAFAVAGTMPFFIATVRAAFAAAQSAATAWPVDAAIVAFALIPIGSAAAAGILASVLQTGGLRFGEVAVKFERLNPVEGLRRMASRETLSHAARAGVAFGIASAAMVPPLLTAASEMVRTSAVSATAAAAWHAVGRVTSAACGTGLLFAIAEYGAARSAWLRKLRMSFEERKREAKEQDGDPLARGRRRALHRALLSGAIAKVKDASFVVANPTHVAIALEYRPPKVSVPLVVVRAAGEAALRVRALAAAHRVPVIENAPLARALYRDARAGHPIARAHYVAVAEIVLALARTKTADS
ncbi:MAG: EscU/YscU/HrcU family type III secretion system export apparatus switch protein [Candidatus Tumulicola sp.]